MEKTQIFGLTHDFKKQSGNKFNSLFPKMKKKEQSSPLFGTTVTTTSGT